MEDLKQEKLNWIKLCRSSGIGPKTFHTLIKIYGSATRALDKISSLGIANNKKLSIHNIEKEIEKTIEYGAELICSFEDNYPKDLHNIGDYPPVITMLGNKDLPLKYNLVAIVGARNASTNGLKFATSLAKQLGNADVVIVSGLAKGIDSAAHEGSIKTGSIAVIASGINYIYPHENSGLYHKLKESGLIISELPFDTAPLPKYFPQRNRIISAIAKAVIVVEAAKSSGSLITAKYAITQGREVFAVPGSPMDSRYSGTNFLIKNGARLLESANDVLKFLNKPSVSLFNNEILSSSKNTIDINTTKEKDLDIYREKLLNSLSITPCSMEDIIKAMDIPIDIFNLLLVELELAGKIERTFGNKLNLIK